MEEKNKKETADMQKVVAKTEEVIAILKGNLEKHDYLFNCAVSGYWEKAKEATEKARKEWDKALAKKRKNIIDKFKELEKQVKDKSKPLDGFHFSSSVTITNLPSLEYPRSHAEDYQKAIKMLELSVYDQVTLSLEEFNNYVMNDWKWIKPFDETVTTYALDSTGFAGGLYSGFFNKR